MKMSVKFSNNTLNFTVMGDTASTEDDDIVLKLIFVRNGTKMTDDMQLAIETATERLGASAELFIEIITAEECVNLNKGNVKIGPKRLFIFDDFNNDNQAFNYITGIQDTCAFGCRAILTILLEGISSPAGIYHINNFAMRNLMVCTSGLKKETKKKIEKLVNYMGGHYTADLVQETTHLVTEGVQSEKYEKAAKTKRMKIMHTDWVFHLWQKSHHSKENINANDVQFDRYKIPIFLGLIIASTGLTRDVRENIKRLVEENGGTYSPSLQTSTTILLVDEDNTSGSIKKIEVATKSKKMCVKYQWIYESVKQNYAVSFENFKYVLTTSMKASTPTKKTNVTASNFNPDDTQLSYISNTTSAEISINETVLSTRSRVTRSSYVNNQSHVVEVKKTRTSTITNYSLSSARKVGALLDGYNVYLDGVSKEELAMITKVLNVLGAMKFNEIEENVTHVLVGDLSSDLFTRLQSSGIEPSVLKIEWLKKVIEMKGLVDEHEYEISNPAKQKQRMDHPSPASKKVMSSMNHSFKKPTIPKFRLEQQKAAEMFEPENDIIEQYLQEPPPQLQPQPQPSTSHCDSQASSSYDSADRTIFITKNVFVYGYNSVEESANIIELLEEIGATLVDATFKREVDFVVTPVEIGEIEIPVKYKNLVSDLYVYQSHDEHTLVNVEFFHRPILKLESPLPLQDEVLVITNYKSYARAFVKFLIEKLGGIPNETMVKSDAPIIITNSSEGKKFEHAVQWKLAALTVDWLFECNKNRSRVDETPFLVGNARPSSRNLKVQNRPSVVPSSQFNSSNFDIYDPPIENVEESPIRKTPKNVGQFSSCIKKCLGDMPTPIRDVVINTMNANIKRCGNGTPSYSTQPETSDETPNTREHQKRRREAMDDYFAKPSEKRPRTQIEKPNLPEPSPTFQYKRHNYFRRRIEDYNSPLPVGGDSVDSKTEENSEKILSATKLNFVEEKNQEETEGFHFFENRQKEDPKPKFKKISIDEPELYSHPAFEQLLQEKQSENLVEWDSGENKHIFEFSNVTDKDREDLREIVYNLGGIVEQEGSNKPIFTHLITTKPSKGQKYLAGIAAGAFMLHPRYLKKCNEEGMFVDETEFEFGNPDSQLTQQNDDDIAQAGWRWRQWIKKTHRDRFHRGAFTNVNFIMLTKDQVAITTVMKRGGGRHVDIELTSKTTVDELKYSNVNYCFFDARSPIKSDIKRTLELAEVKIRNWKAISRFMMSQKVPNEIPQ